MSSYVKEGRGKRSIGGSRSRVFSGAFEPNNHNQGQGQRSHNADYHYHPDWPTLNLLGLDRGLTADLLNTPYLEAQSDVHGHLMSYSRGCALEIWSLVQVEAAASFYAETAGIESCSGVGL